MKSLWNRALLSPTPTVFSILFIAAAVTFSPLVSEAYPEFIGYGYKACLTCHYSGTGGGALNDYGRALFAAEIAAKPFWASHTEDDKLAEYANFLGPVKSPYWLKPGIKYRRLALRPNPGTGADQQDYKMQADLNLASFTNEDASLGAIVTLSWAEKDSAATPNTRVGGSQMMAREYYVRWQQSEHIWWYGGLFDKAYGIKNVDHTAFNREPLKIGANDQVHGLMMQYTNEKNDLFIHPFYGNATQAGDVQSHGLSVLYEYEIIEKLALGATAKYEESKQQTLSSAAATVRYGFPAHHAILSELGLKNNKLQGLDEQLGGYWYLESSTQLARGLSFQSIFQFERAAFTPDFPETYQWGFGLLFFPFQRVELRASAVQSRARSASNVQEDQWTAQGQLHLSL